MYSQCVLLCFCQLLRCLLTFLDVSQFDNKYLLYGTVGALFVFCNRPLLCHTYRRFVDAAVSGRVLWYTGCVGKKAKLAGVANVTFITTQYNVSVIQVCICFVL